MSVTFDAHLPLVVMVTNSNWLLAGKQAITMPTHCSTVMHFMLHYTLLPHMIQLPD